MGYGIWIATAIMALALTALGILVLRFGPHRGDWNNPAAKYRPPGVRVQRAMIALAAFTVVLGGIAGFAVTSGGTWVLVITMALAGVYLAMAFSARIAQRVVRRRGVPDDGPDARAASTSLPPDHTE
jgi:hypothetical protein